MTARPTDLSSFDPVATELLGNALDTAVDEMSLTMVRGARANILREAMDFCCGLLGPTGDVIAQGVSMPFHLGTLPDAIAATLRHFGDDIHPGDLLFMNDPFNGGMHLPDFFLFRPVFAEGRRIGFAAVCAHMTDVGGRVPGGNASDSTEIYQEGLRIPLTKLFSRGERNEFLFRLIEANVRVPETVLGDLEAAIAAGISGESALLELVEQYGAENLDRRCRELLDYTERMTRTEIATWPSGSYSFQDYLDDDGLSPDPIPIHVKLTIGGDGVTADVSGSSRQVRAAINSSYSATCSSVYMAVRALMPLHMPNNSGYFRPIGVIAPPGSIFNHLPPAPSGARGVTCLRLVDAMFGALAQALPGRVCAASDGGNTFLTIGGYDGKGVPFIFVEPHRGSWGARPDQDGLEGCTRLSAIRNSPLEMVEAEFPLRIESYGFERDSGGAGRFRGGLAITRSTRLLEGDAILQVRADRTKFLPYGLHGGRPGTPSRSVLVTAGEERTMPGKFTANIQAGDLFVHTIPGSGGYGDPLDRDPEAVRRDVRLEKLTAEYARREYGVVVDPAGMSVDQPATARLREELRQAEHRALRAS